jgi:hypothetical protein
VLWELLTAKRLFVAETDMGVLRLIQSAKIEPPSTFNPAVPQALDAIVLKSLTRDKNKRYQGAEEFQRDLHKFLYSFNPSFNPADLSYYAQELFKTEIRDDRDRLTKYLSMDPVDDGSADEQKSSKKNLSTKLADGLISTTDFNREMMDMVAKEGSGNIDKPSDIQLMSSAAMPQPKNAQVAPPAPGKPPAPGATTSSVPPQQKTLNMPTAGMPTAGMPTAGLPTAGMPTAGLPTAGLRKPADGMVIPPWSKQAVGSNGMPKPGTRTATALRKELDDQHSSNGRNIAVLLTIFCIGAVVAARQYGFLQGTFLDPVTPQMAGNLASDTDRRPSNEAHQPAIPVGQGEGIIVLQTKTTGYAVYVDGKQVSVHNNQFTVPLNQPVNVRVAKFGFQPAKFQTKVTGQAPVAFRVDLVALPSGLLHMVTTPETNVTIYSGSEKVMERRTPIRGEGLPVGSYRLVMENSLLNLRAEAEVEIEEGRITRIEKVLGR